MKKITFKIDEDKTTLIVEEGHVIKCVKVDTTDNVQKVWIENIISITNTLLNKNNENE